MAEQIPAPRLCWHTFYFPLHLEDSKALHSTAHTEKVFPRHQFGDFPSSLSSSALTLASEQ